MASHMLSIRDSGRVVYKVDVINDAYSRLRISGLTVNPTPEDLELALVRLEDMMAMWESRNIIVDYNFEDEPDPNSVTNVKSNFRSAMAANLAVDLIPDFNKQVPPVLFNQAASLLDNISGRIAMQRLNQVPYPKRQPIGSGNSLRWNRWVRFYRDQKAPNTNRSFTIFNGDSDDYQVNFDSYLGNDETLFSFDVQVDGGLRLESSSADATTVFFRLTGDIGSEDGQRCSQVIVIVRTSDNRIETRKLFFTIKPRDTAALEPIIETIHIAQAGNSIMQAGNFEAQAGNFITQPKEF